MSVKTLRTDTEIGRHKPSHTKRLRGPISKAKAKRPLTKDEKKLRNIIRENIIYRRNALGMTQEELGAAMEKPVSQAAVWNWEIYYGAKFPSQARLLRIAKALKATIISLMTPHYYKAQYRKKFGRAIATDSDMRNVYRAKNSKNKAALGAGITVDQLVE